MVEKISKEYTYDEMIEWKKGELDTPILEIANMRANGLKETEVKRIVMTHFNKTENEYEAIVEDM